MILRSLKRIKRLERRNKRPDKKNGRPNRKRKIKVQTTAMPIR